LSTTRLKGHVGIVVAGVVLAVLAALSILAVLPGMAEAQEEAEAQEDMGPTASVEAEQNSTTDDEKGASATTRLVVEPGDSLWSISEEHIGPGATPEQIAYEVERIFELNRDQIGENPNLIFPGQEFFLVSAAPGGAAAAPEQPVAVAEQQQAPTPIVVESEGVSDSPAAEDAAIEDVVPEDGVSEGAVSEDAIPTALPSRDQTDEQAESAPAESVTAESAPAESTPAESAAPATTAGSIGDSVLEAYNNLKGERRLLGVGILALTLIVALLMAWRLPMRRNVEDPQAWGIPQQQYYENYAPAEAPRQAPPETARGPEGEPNGAASGAASGPPPEEATPEPSVVSSNSTSPAANGAEEDVLAESSHVAEGGAVAASSPDQERLRRIRHLRRISQRRSPSGWRGG
jgi:LysM repeat protein